MVFDPDKAGTSFIKIIAMQCVMLGAVLFFLIVL